MDDTILSVKHLALATNNETLLEDVSFNVQRGETTIFLGPNGAGKTTLFRALLSIHP